MNCDEYRQAIGADPSFDGGAGHVSECASCQDYRREMLALEDRISRALAINVPDIAMPELEEVAASNVVDLTARRRKLTPVWLAAAATVLVAAFIGVRFGGLGSPGYDSLADEVLAHVTHEPRALLPSDVRVQERELAKVVPASIAELDQSKAFITYAETCPISGNNVPHLVIQGKSGPITIMLLPDEKISEAISLNNETSHGVILPVGDGSIAIVGARDENLEDVQRQLLQSVTWET